MKFFVAALLFAASLFATSESTFPSNWKSFKSLSTPLTKIGALPDCKADVSSLPKIYQETVATYCAVKSGGPGRVEVLLKPDSVPAYSKRDGKFSDGDTLILHLSDMKLLFVTQYKDGKPLYGIYTEDGKDVSSAKAGSGLTSAECRSCHTGYKAYCTNGQCGVAGK